MDSLIETKSGATDGSPFHGVSGYAPFERNPRQSGGVPGASLGSSKAHDRAAAHRLTHLDLFSGIGGFALAAQWAGIETIGFAEVEPYACKVLSKHWPEVKNYGDIKSVGRIECDIITGGFPCQPFSVAGQRKGKEDNRHLWPEMLRVVSLCRPTWVLGENVPGITNMELDQVLADLGSAGYACQTFNVPACAVDARHRRARLWILAYAERAGQQDRWSESCERVARSLCAWKTPQNVCSETSESGSVFGGARWSTEPRMDRVAHGVSRRVDRLKGLGNAIVPQVAFVFLDAIAALELAGAQAGLPGSSGSSKADERTDREHNGAQEHNEKLSGGFGSAATQTQRGNENGK